MTAITDALGGLTQFAYDPNGNLLSLTDARTNATTYAYNSMDRVTTRTDPLLRAETYGYDNNGSPTSITDRKSQVTGSTYDALDRLSQATYQDASTTTFTYDAGNRVTQVADSIGGTITFTYDGLDQLLSETTAQGTVSYTYDAAGRRATMSVPGQALISYGYDNADRLTTITHGTSTVSFGYDTAGRRTNLTLPNGIATEYGYDPASRLTGLTYKLGANTLGTLTYGYSGAGHRVLVGGSWSRTGQPQPVVGATYNAANHQLTFSGQTLTYDLNGNLTSDGTNIYTWNARNQLAGITGPVPASFIYDGLGRRSRKAVNGTSTDFVYDGVNPVRELQAAGTVNLLTGLSIDEYFTRANGAVVTAMLSDALGSTIALSDAAGTVATEYTYEAFGTTTATGATSANPFTYTGREDDGTSLKYYRARYYHPGLHRFVAEDPICFAAGSLNVYAYVDNGPTNFVDPTGMFAVALAPLVPAAIQAGVAVGGFVAGAVVGAAIWDYISFARGQSDPYVLPRVNPGRNARGKCNPCPPPPPPWQAPGDAHGSTGGSHWHWLFYNQDPQTCECYPTRGSGPKRPDSWPPQPKRGK